jgi:hypothetical protein
MSDALIPGGRLAAKPHESFSPPILRASVTVSGENAAIRHRSQAASVARHIAFCDCVKSLHCR